MARKRTQPKLPPNQATIDNYFIVPKKRGHRQIIEDSSDDSNETTSKLQRTTTQCRVTEVSEDDTNDSNAVPTIAKRVMLETEADKTSLDRSGGGNASSSETPEPLLDEDLGEGDVTDEEDWASIGAAALRAQSLPSSGRLPSGAFHLYQPIADYPTTSRNRSQASGPPAIAHSVPQKATTVHTKRQRDAAQYSFIGLGDDDTEVCNTTSATTNVQRKPASDYVLSTFTLSTKSVVLGYQTGTPRSSASSSQTRTADCATHLLSVSSTTGSFSVNNKTTDTKALRQAVKSELCDDSTEDDLDASTTTASIPQLVLSAKTDTEVKGAPNLILGSVGSSSNLEDPTRTGSQLRLSQLHDHLRDAEIIDLSRRSDLKAILAISRLSFRTWDEDRISRLEERSSALAKFMLKVHCQQHLPDCKCHPTKHNFFLNGISSNNAGSPDAREAHILEPVIVTLRQLLNDSNDERQISIIVSTSDGFLTNVDGFAAFFEPFRALNLWYLVHDGGTSYRHLTVNSILQAIEDIRDGDSGSSTAHGLVQEFAGIATGKVVITKGKTMVRYIAEQRNATKIDNITDLDAEQNSMRIKDATITVVRWHRIAGTESHPLFERVIEERMPPKVVSGRLICPVIDCPQATVTLDEMVVHLIEDHIHEGACPLCRRPFNKLGYDFVIDCIYHMQRHLTMARQLATLKMKNECPYCFKLLGDSNSMARHIETHLQQRKVLDFANIAGTIEGSERQLYDSMQYAARRTAATVQLSQMSTLLQQVTYDVPLIPGLVTLDSSQQSTLSVPTPVSDGDRRVFAQFLMPNAKQVNHLKDAGIQLLDDGRIACPLPDCCDEIFDRTWECARHVLRRLIAAELGCPWCRPEKQSIFRATSTSQSRVDVGHIQKHLPPSIPCPEKGCRSKFSHQTHIYWHMKTKHNGKASD